MKSKSRTQNAHGGCGAARLLACSSCGDRPIMTHSIHGKEKYAVWCDKCKAGGPVRVYRMRAARDWNKRQQANEKLTDAGKKRMKSTETQSRHSVQRLVRTPNQALPKAKRNTHKSVNKACNDTHQSVISG